MVSIGEVLNEQISRLNKELEGLKPGSQEHQRLSMDIAKLSQWYASILETETEREIKEKQMQIDEAKNATDWAQKEEDRKVEKAKLRQARAERALDREHEAALEKERNRFRLRELAVPLTLTVVSNGLFIWAYNRAQDKNLQFEETGRFCSDTGRNLRFPSLDRILKR